ncbi:MAG: ATP-binding domain-containing protein [Gammaproteobacteria bacterium]
MPPSKSIATIHKAKGLECENALLIPCDKAHFPDTDAARCRLYVALSRARRSLTLVVSAASPSPLLKI